MRSCCPFVAALSICVYQTFVLAAVATCAKTPAPLAGAKPEDVVLADGGIALKHDPRRAVPIADAMRQGGLDRIDRQKESQPAKGGKHARNTHSAIFAEVKIDEQLGVIRVTRLVSAIAAGRIVNPKTARSQIMGEMADDIIEFTAKAARR